MKRYHEANIMNGSVRTIIFLERKSLKEKANPDKYIQLIKVSNARKKRIFTRCL